MKPEVYIGQQLTKSGRSLAVAESCTGGLIAHRLTNVAGASAYFPGGMVTYSNESKLSLLGVSSGGLERYGAVSAAVAQQMAEGVARAFDADFGVGVTGIAGPAGGTKEKPVGLVYIAVSGPGQPLVHREVFPGDRDAVKQASAQKALELALQYIMEHTE